MDNKLYRSGVGIILLNKENKVFVAKRFDNPHGPWQMPQGGIDEGEIPLEAALRELYEEVGINNVDILKESKNWYSYDFPKELAATLWQGRYQGQKQKWFLMLFLGQDEDIDLNTHHPEFCEWQWTEVENLPSLVIPFKKRLYEDILKELLPKKLFNK
ncbi:RNA pyrophosphohydrolase [Candidatus Nucleicultrix amoebiphila]|jgi:putative (di)nucleoside polyphosphate hydrolase|uniref:RNA pyrophosphohydrolase n=1 Tax=Candidatus Nucleicultrix amoebiphila FS5 TaxID=1414854 RepID=A0A1W6N3J2_9PROT|nr:RNA pyrophosphohydrolase [Candidatus Nucleicultrix amoebiphila]ARN84444.1 RNA pyrophosphohydrolase [Candidatus Nucleicultrix amoebiphila FS5]